jgi:excisionase family DNA binding protein
MTSPDPARLLTIEEAAALANYPASTIRRWIERGLPHIAPGWQTRPRRKDIRIRASALENWLRGLEVARSPRDGKSPVGTPGKRPGSSQCLSAWRSAKP